MTNITKGLMTFTTILATAATAFAATTGDNTEIYRTYGYDMCEDYYVARKQAIKNGKLLFVLSGSASCNYTAFLLISCVVTRASQKCFLFSSPNLFRSA